MTTTIQQLTVQSMAQPTRDQLSQSMQALQEAAEAGYDLYLENCRKPKRSGTLNLNIYRFYAARSEDKDDMYWMTKELFEKEILNKIREDKQKRLLFWLVFVCLSVYQYHQYQTYNPSQSI